LFRLLGSADPAMSMWVISLAANTAAPSGIEPDPLKLSEVNGLATVRARTSGACT